MECPNCKLVSPPGSVRCDCGYAFLTGTISAPTQHSESVPLAGAISNPTQRLESAPYATFVSLVFGSALLVSVLVFNVAQALARNRWEATISTAVATVGAALLARSARGVHGVESSRLSQRPTPCSGTVEYFGTVL